MTDKDNTFVGLDMSGSQTRCLVAASDGTNLRYVSCGAMPPTHWRDVAERVPQMTPESVLEAVCEAENGGGLTILSAVVGIGGAQARSSLVHSAVALPSGQRTVLVDDVRSVVKRAAGGVMSPSLTGLQLIPLEFVAGRHSGLQNPIGLYADRLEAYVRVISSPRAEHERVTRLVNQASVRVEETVLAGFGAAYGTLFDAERSSGVAHLEIGKTSSSLTAYCGGALHLACGISVGRDDLVNDVSRAFATDPLIASSLISDFGSAAYHSELNGAYVFVPSRDESSAHDNGRMWPRNMLDKIIALRIEECMTLALDELRHEGLAGGSVRSLVLTGDIAELPGVREMAQSVLGLRSRVGVPTRPEGLPEALRSPGWACAAGLVLYAHRLSHRPEEEDTEHRNHARMLTEEKTA